LYLYAVRHYRSVENYCSPRHWQAAGGALSLSKMFATETCYVA